MVTINGKIEKISAISLLDYLEKNKYRIDRIVVEYNGEIIKKDKFSKIMIQDKDSIEIVSLVGGG
ncbi:sulfur carrier protein ThiS [Fusobacterium massiliense]|jgi:thiamine biosynthesis protein thiS|uniref:sulfur carrier protein ThiS n=1 Tax=Fusobacterium massiliense TaxID=1852365 RepID=UPI00093BD899|nr:sulfur carrier protein ThiS [Fusobacterium massiliense]